MVPPVSAHKGRVSGGSCESAGDRGTGTQGRRDHRDRRLGPVPRRLVARLADPRAGQPRLPPARLAPSGDAGVVGGYLGVLFGVVAVSVGVVSVCVFWVVVVTVGVGDVACGFGWGVVGVVCCSSADFDFLRLVGTSV